MIREFTSSEQPSENVFYLASSATQKCIRRGNVVGALNFAKIMWKCKTFRMWQRMWVWLSEDCGRNLEALKLFREWRGKEFENHIPLICEMAKGPKDRAGLYLSQIIQGKHVQPIRLWNTFKDTLHIDVIQLYKHWDDGGYEVYDSLGDFEDRAWIIELCERGHKNDRDGFITAIPYFFMKDKICNGGTRNECEPLTMYDDYFPLEAVDGHTRPGQAAYAIYCKHRSHPEIGLTSSYAMKPFVFYNEGWLLRNCDPYPFNFAKYQMEGIPAKTRTKTEAWYTSEEVGKMMRETVLPEINAVRRWTLDKQYVVDMTRMKKEYYKDFIE